MSGGSRVAKLGRTGKRYRRMRRDVLVQYGPLCWICGRHIDTSLPANHPDSYEPDHLDPLSLGGKLLDTSRIRPSHRHCNGGRRNAPAAYVERNSEDW